MYNSAVTKIFHEAIKMLGSLLQIVTKALRNIIQVWCQPTHSASETAVIIENFTVRMIVCPTNCPTIQMRM